MSSALWQSSHFWLRYLFIEAARAILKYGLRSTPCPRYRYSSPCHQERKLRAKRGKPNRQTKPKVGIIEKMTEYLQISLLYDVYGLYEHLGEKNGRRFNAVLVTNQICNAMQCSWWWKQSIQTNQIIYDKYSQFGDTVNCSREVFDWSCQRDFHWQLAGPIFPPQWFKQKLKCGTSTPLTQNTNINLSDSWSFTITGALSAGGIIPSSQDILFRENKISFHAWSCQRISLLCKLGWKREKGTHTHTHAVVVWYVTTGFGRIGSD